MRTPWAILAVSLLTLPAASGQAPESFLDTVQAGDADVGRTLHTFRSPVVFQDANGNQRPDASSPDEPFYLDLDNSESVTYGDLRLTALANAAAGTPIAVSDVDLGRGVQKAAGRFASAAGNWYVDVDADGKVSVGDLQLEGLDKVRASSSALGKTLVAAAASDLSRTADGTLYLDLDTVQGAEQRVSPGDLRIQPLAPAAAPAAPASPAAGAPASQQPSAASGPATDGPPAAKAPDGGLRMLDGVLLALAVLNLAGLLFVVRTVSQLRGPPKSPFR